ncbi:MAG: site-specific DNA-methyltransferase [Christensenellaceae bacterium]|jgi:adenine-specific DNA-methyltransferase|nr:site-specific DNA-methyltransferase [Christensenellaceae bacterium]
MKKIDGLTPDIVAERIKDLKAVFPEIFEDGQVDFDALRNLLGEYIEDAREKYSFTWAGKLDAIRLAQKRSTGTLRPCRAESVDFDTSENLYIEGDNLEVLKLLSGSYMNRVKMIYIDPPYNTGNDFVYADDFSDSIANYKQVIGDSAKSNAETAGRYHTNWLNMMLPRLKLARVLLQADGIIFVSCDDNESTNLKKLMDEVFGEYNYIGQITVVGNPGGRDYGGIARMHDYIYVYSKTDAARLNLIEDKENCFTQFDERGGFELRELRNRNIKFNKENRPNLYYPFHINTMSADANGLYEISLEPKVGWLKLYPLESQGINTVWRWGKEKSKANLNTEIKAKRMINGGYQIVEKYRESRVMARSVWWDKDTNTEKGTLTVKELFNSKVFDYPKPVELLIKMLQMGTCPNEGDIVLDFFSGSATTAHAVMQQNAADNGNRKFICIQLPELIDAETNAFKAGYKNLCEIGKERIRRAAKKIKDDAPMLTAELDTGFKVFKLDTSNLKRWNNEYTRDYDELAMRIKDFYEYLMPDRTPLDMVYEIMLKYSLPLTLPVEAVTVANATVHMISHAGDESVDAYKVLVCMQEDLSIEQMESLSALGAGTLFFADRCFADTNAMTNCDEILKKAVQEMRLF